MICLKVLAISAALIVTSSAAEDFKVVKLKQGNVKGFKSEAYEIYEFHGIPYATAPKGRDRFKAPLPPPTWSETFVADKRKVFCPQHIMDITIKPEEREFITEDCLVANVFVPETKNKPLPVLVDVHSGGFQLGHGNINTLNNLASKGLVTVSFNYRLLTTGFLCMGSENIPGNAGMKDQVALLRWVKENIASFGGNPEDVTIIGTSAGSASVELLMLSHTTKGLFNKVIPNCGSGIGAWAVQPDPIEVAVKFAHLNGFESSNLNEIEEFFLTAPLEKLNSHFLMNKPNMDLLLTPCVERNTGTEMFLKDYPVNILRKGDFERLPVLMGFSNMEGLMHLNNINYWKDAMNEDFSIALPADLKFKSEEEKSAVAKAVKEFYFGEKPIGEDTEKEFVEYYSDMAVIYPTLRSVKLNVESGNNEVYLFEYSYVDDELLANKPNKHIRGADHCANAMALGEFPDYEPANVTETFKEVRKLLRDLWYNFITTGKPVPEPTHLLPEGWPAVTANGGPHMSLDARPELKGRFKPENMDFWHSIYDAHYRAPVSPFKRDMRTEL